MDPCLPALSPLLGGGPHSRSGLQPAHPTQVGFSGVADFVYCVTVRHSPALRLKHGRNHLSVCLPRHSQRIIPFYRRPGWINGAFGLDGALSASFTRPPDCRRHRVVTVSPANLMADIRPAALPSPAGMASSQTCEAHPLNQPSAFWVRPSEA